MAAWTWRRVSAPHPGPEALPSLISCNLGRGWEAKQGGGFPAQPEAWLPPLPDCSITKFLNRILGLEVHKQNALFQYFSDTFDHLIEMDKREGKYDMGILGERRCRGVVWVGVGEGLVGMPCILGGLGARGNTGHPGWARGSWEHRASRVGSGLVGTP